MSGGTVHNRHAGGLLELTLDRRKGDNALPEPVRRTQPAAAASSLASALSAAALLTRY